MAIRASATRRCICLTTDQITFIARHLRANLMSVLHRCTARYVLGWLVYAEIALLTTPEGVNLRT